MASAKLIRYKYKVLSDGSSPIMMQVIHNRKVARYAIGSEYKCKEQQWDAAAREFTRSFRGYKVKNRVLMTVELRASEILDDLIKSGKPFTFQHFEERYRSINQKQPTVYEFFDIRVEEMTAQGKVGNARVYADMKRALMNYSPNPNLMFPDIDYKFLNQYETYLRSRKCSGGGIHNYMRTLRALVNEAIRRKYLPKESYPFKNQFNNDGYSLAHLKSTASPRALSSNDLDKLKNFDPDVYPHLNFAYKIFMFSYYSRGMNFKDIAQLSHQDIYDDRMGYIRAKTGGQFSIKITDPLRAIIEEFRDPENNYLFPILSDLHKTPLQIKNRVGRKLKEVNAGLKEIAKILAIEAQLTTYVARHTFATTLKRQSVDIAKISQSLGHADVMTTKAYLKKFDDLEMDELNEFL